MRISGHGLHELIKMLVAKLQDPNKSLVRMSCSIAGKFAEALGSESKQYARVVVSGLV